MGWIAWTQSEIEIIKDNHDSPMCEWLHMITNHTKGAIVKKAYDMGYVLTIKKRENRPENRFWKFVKKAGADECWEWIGGKNLHGYGRFSCGCIKVLAHRFSWELHNGPIPTGEGYHGTCVLHRCDNPSCVNPTHLRLGTQEDNMQDMSQKGRAVTVRISENAKLSEDQVREIKALLSQKSLSLRTIADRFDISHNAVWMIKQGKLGASVK